MIDRVLHYFQVPTAPGFARHMIERSGLNPEQQKLVWDLRNHSGNTQFFADRAQLPIKRYNATIAVICQRLVGELFRLAQIGWQAEQDRKS